MRIYTKDDRIQQAAAEYLTLISGTFLPKAGSTLLSIAFRCAENRDCRCMQASCPPF